MFKLPFLPESGNYSAAPSARGAILSQALRGGRSRQRRDTPFGSRIVSASFNLDPDQYDRFMTYYRVWEDAPSLFLVDLIIDGASPEEYKATFVADSVSLTDQVGWSYSVAAQFEVLRKTTYKLDPDYIEAFLMLEQEYGSITNAREWIMNPLHEIVGVIEPTEQEILL